MFVSKLQFSTNLVGCCFSLVKISLVDDLGNKCVRKYAEHQLSTFEHFIVLLMVLQAVHQGKELTSDLASNTGYDFKVGLLAVDRLLLLLREVKENVFLSEESYQRTHTVLSNLGVVEPFS